MEKSCNEEIGVEEAARVLGVTPRSVINYIRAKEIKATKVGKVWHINKASLDGFKVRFGFIGHSSIEDNKTEIKEISQKSNEWKKEKIYSVHGLRLFQLAKEALSNVEVQTLFPKDRPDIHEKFFALKSEAIEYMGAGFYSFGNRNKALLYNRSREKIGGLLSLVYFYQKESTKISKDILKIEEELMPAFSSLIRKIDKKNERA